MTERQLFFELLHKARELNNVRDFLRKAYLAGYVLALKQHLEDIKAGQNIAEVWRQQNAGSVDWRG